MESLHGDYRFGCPESNCFDRFASGRWKHITTLNMLRRTSLITVHLAAAVVVIGGGRRKVPLSQQLALKFVDTEQFQRLCDLKQLGLAYMVYPGAVYSRFEHSLGVYFLAAEAVEKLEKYHGLELGVGPINLQTVKLPGLLHDIGHGPFSHLYECEFLPRVLNGCKWSHEDMSVDMVNYNVDEHHIDVNSGILKRAKDGNWMSRNNLATAFLCQYCQEVESCYCCTDFLFQDIDAKELRAVAKVFKACTMLLETPTEIRKVSEKVKSSSSHEGSKHYEASGCDSGSPGNSGNRSITSEEQDAASVEGCNIEITSSEMEGFIDR